MNKSKLPISWLSRLILSKSHQTHKPYSQIHHFSHQNPISVIRPISSTIPTLKSPFKTHHFRNFSIQADEEAALRSLLLDIEEEKHKEREAKKKAGILIDEAAEEEDYLGVTPLIEKLEAQDAKKHVVHNKRSFDKDSDDDLDDGEDSDDPEVIATRKKQDLINAKKLARFEDLTEGLNRSKTMGESLKWMKKIDKFEEKHSHLRLEYRVIGELLDRFRKATSKDKFMLAQKLNRAMRLVEWKEKFDPKDPVNYGVIGRRDANIDESMADEVQREKPMVEGTDDEEEDFDDMKERDDILLAKLNDIDKNLEEKLAALSHTFGKKGKLLEEEIRELAEKRNSLTEKIRKPMYRKGFDTILINLNRTCKVTKGGQVVKYSAIVACGNYNGVVGFAKAKGPKIPVALQKAREKSFQNLHYIERYENHTIAHAIQTKYKRTKLYLWPAQASTGMIAGKTVSSVLNLAGFKNVKSKVVGSRNPYNTVKAILLALNAIETPKDVQEKFGRSVVETQLL
ncbi:uncharacterized protein LOC130800210 [Amaranthus tricolor]|uniref:uncharacterized protein LOC130800210 n=1 Tax=Amaranthus tricolor TaxID=29722 RepID=UPI00258EF073|nr:uncharacterized protein LOC130800210 [Amaranthus tricolor]